MTPKGPLLIVACCLTLLSAACGDEAPKDGNAAPAAQNASMAAPAPPATPARNASAAPPAPATPVPDAAHNASAAPPADASQDMAAPQEDDGEARKWNSYVVLANEVDAGVLALLEDYAANFPDREYSAPDADFAFRRLSGGERPRGVAGAVNEAMANALLEPQSELDPLALAYARALNDLWLALNAAVDYHEQGEYRADAAARGPELHRAVVEASQAYWPASDAFGLALLRRDEEMMRASVSHLRQNSMPLHAAVLDLVLQARELERELYSRFQSEGSAPDFSAPAWTGATAKFSRACKSLEKKLADAGQRKKEDLNEEDAAALAGAARAMCDYAPGISAGGEHGNASALDEFPELMNVFISTVNTHLQ